MSEYEQIAVQITHLETQIKSLKNELSRLKKRQKQVPLPQRQQLPTGPVMSRDPWERFEARRLYQHPHSLENPFPRPSAETLRSFGLPEDYGLPSFRLR
jgi:hypothetical protein